MKKLTALFAAILFSGVLHFSAPIVLATTSQETVCKSIGAVSGAGGCAEPTDSPGVGSLVATVINLLSYAVGILAAIMIIVGAAKYMTSGGDGNAVAAAKKTIMYALIGLVLAVMGQALVRFTLNKATHSSTPPPSGGGGVIRS